MTPHMVNLGCSHRPRHLSPLNYFLLSMCFRWWCPGHSQFHENFQKRTTHSPTESISSVRVIYRMIRISVISPKNATSSPNCYFLRVNISIGTRLAAIERNNRQSIGSTDKETRGGKFSSILVPGWEKYIGNGGRSQNNNRSWLHSREQVWAIGN